MAHLDHISVDHAALKGADLLHNLGTMLANFRCCGARAFDCFDCQDSLVDVPWYYCGSAEKVIKVLGPHSSLSQALQAVMSQLIGLVGLPPARLTPKLE